MDDILIVNATPPWWNKDAFFKDFERSECYHAPLKLEKGAENTFLETRFKVINGQFQYWLKNDNENGATKVWRYKHFISHAPYLQKRAVLAACLKKVQKMASNRELLFVSALEKIAEFLKLQYPSHVIRAVCTYLAASQGEYTWLDVRDQIHQIM